MAIIECSGNEAIGSFIPCLAEVRSSFLKIVPSSPSIRLFALMFDHSSCDLPPLSSATALFVVSSTKYSGMFAGKCRGHILGGFVAWMISVSLSNPPVL